MPTGAAHRFSDLLDAANLGEDELNSLDTGANVYTLGPGSLNVAVSPGRYTTSGGIIDFAGAPSLALAPSAVNQQIYLTVPGNVLTVGPFPGGEHLPLAECDTSGVEVIAVRDKRPRMTSALSPTAPGDVNGPASSLANELAVFNGVTGKLLQDGSGVTNTGPGALNGRVLVADGAKLDGIATGAQVNAANATDGEVTTGTEVAKRAVSPAQLKLAATTHAPGQTRTLWIPADPDVDEGSLRAREVLASGSWRFNLAAPADMVTLIAADLIGVVKAGADAGARDIDLVSEFGALGEARNFNTASDLASTFNFAGLLDSYAAVPLATVLAGLAPGDVGGVLVTHNAIGGAVRYLGIRLTYTVQ